MYQWIISELQKSPEILLFLSLAFGYLIGKINFGKFQLGGVAGSLVMGVVFSLLNVHVGDGIKGVLFAIFIYAVGYTSGPQFFKSLGPKSAREIALAVFVAASGFFTIVILSYIFHLDKGLAAGLAAGGLTQSAIIGTAGDALTHLNLSPAELKRLQDNIAIGYAVTYVFGSLGAIIICAHVVPKFMGRGIREDAIVDEKLRLNGAIALSSNQTFAAQEIVGRIYLYNKNTETSVKTLEDKHPGITVEKIKRKNEFIDFNGNTSIKHNDTLLIVGRRTAVIEADDTIGKEIGSTPGMEVVMETVNVVLRNKKYLNKPISKIDTKDIRHGLYVLAIHRNNTKLVLSPNLTLKTDDVVTLYGMADDIKRVEDKIGLVIPISDKTDWVFHGFGLTIGLLIGLIVVRLGGIPLTLGAGGGALLSGLIFGWYRIRHPLIGNLPSGAAEFMKDIGLAGFVAIIGLQSGYEAITTIMESGLTLFLIGVVVTVLPLILALPFGRYVLGYSNSARFAGALAGARSANPALGSILDKAENSSPTVSFAITYALANVFLTLLGPLIVAFG